MKSQLAVDALRMAIGRLDHLAYGAGLWLGAARARSVRCLAPSTQRAC